MLLFETALFACFDLPILYCMYLLLFSLFALSFGFLLSNAWPDRLSPAVCDHRVYPVLLRVLRMRMFRLRMLGCARMLASRHGKNAQKGNEY